MPNTTPPTPPTSFTQRRIEAAGLSVNCREAGAGLPVVILESLAWGQTRFYDALAQQFHLFILELPPANAADAVNAINAVTALTGQLIHGPYTLIGASQAANLALQIAQQDPAAAQLEALILISPTAVRPAADILSLPPAQLADLLLAHPEQATDLAGLPDGDDLPRLLLSDANAAQMESRLGEVRCPTLVAFGSRDRLVAPGAPAAYRSQIPNCHLSLVYDAGHLIAAERPEALTNAVADFVENRETFVVNRQPSLINP